jgi:hypothetical protein
MAELLRGNKNRGVEERGAKNDWNTTKHIWTKLLPYIPKDKQVWCPFYNRSAPMCEKYLTDLGINVIHKDEDFWENNHGDCVIDNPPYKISGIIKLKEKIMIRLMELNKPFMLLFPASTIQTTFFLRLYEKGGFQLIVPSEKYDFERYEGEKTRSMFYTIWVCWNMNLPNDFIVI